MNTRTTVVVADDHALVRTMTRNWLISHAEIGVVREAVDGHEALAHSRKFAPDVLLLDLGMEGPPALEIVRLLAASQYKTRVLIFTGRNLVDDMAGLLSSGIAGYLLKEDVTESILPAIRSVIRGEQWYSPLIAKMYGDILGNRKVQA